MYIKVIKKLDNLFNEYNITFIDFQKKFWEIMDLFKNFNSETDSVNDIRITINNFLNGMVKSSNNLFKNNIYMTKNITKKQYFYIKIYQLYNRVFIDTLRYIILVKPKKYIKLYNQIKENINYVNKLGIDYFKIIKDYNNGKDITQYVNDFFNNSKYLIKYFNKGSDDFNYIDSLIYYNNLINIIRFWTYLLKTKY